jgi:hypothetical protein
MKLDSRILTMINYFSHIFRPSSFVLRRLSSFVARGLWLAY